MENFILYEELGAGCSSVVYKGRRKGSLNYVAIICTGKSNKFEITNHVRLSHDLDHPNIVRFYEWYETSNHLWLVVELCTGGSLESVIAHDGHLPEDELRKFGWHLLIGLKHIHESGIILSDLSPTKIFLDGSGILKFGKFCLSKAKGERLEDILALISTSKESGKEDDTDHLDNIRKRFQGYPTYRAPEVLQGSETSMSSDLWALGCILYYMYTGKPPFYSDCQAELKEMILHQAPPPPSHTSPFSQDFQSLLKLLLDKNPDTRMDWAELLHHPFWTLLKGEDDAQDGDEKNKTAEKNGCEGVGMVNLRRTHDLFPSGPAVSLTCSHSAVTQLSCRVSDKLRDDPDDLEPSGVEQMCQTVQANKSLMTACSDNVLALRPKNGVDEDNTEAIFLLSSHTISRRSCNTADSPNQNCAVEMRTGIDIRNCVKRLLHTETEMTVTPVIDNPKILKSTSVRFDPKTLCVPAYSAEKLQTLSDEEWTAFLLQICSFLEEQIPSTPVPSSSTVPPSTTIRSKLNLLCYLCVVVGHTVIANKIMNSTLLLVLTKQLRRVPNWDLRSKVLRVMGLLALHCSHLEGDSSVSEALSTLTDLLRENLRNSKLKQFLIPPLGEFLYLILSQEKRGSPEGLWFVPAAAYTGLMRSLREGDDAIVHHMAAKTIENISTVVSATSHHLVTPEAGSALWYLFTHSTVEAVRVTAISSLSRLTRLDPAVFLSVIDTCGPEAILEGVGGAGARVQQHLLTAVATGLLASQIQTHHIAQSQELVLKVLRCLESPSTVTRAKAILLLLLLIQDNTQTLLYCCQHRLVMYLERDLRKAAPLRENPSQSGYLSQCLELLVAHLTGSGSAIMDAVLSALEGVTGRKHPSTTQSRLLKQTLPTMCVVLELLSSQIFRSRIATKEFLVQIGLLLKYIASVASNESNLASAVGAAVCEELIRTTLFIVEVLSQHHTLITPFHSTVVDDVLPPLTTLVFSKNVEWSVLALKVLAELSLLLLVQDYDHTEVNEEGIPGKKEKEDTRDETAERVKDERPCSQALSQFMKSLLLRYDCLLRAAEPIPLFALKLLVLLTEHSTQICRLINHSRVLPMVFHLIMANSVTSGLVQNAVVLLCNISGNTVFDQQPIHQEGLIEVVVSTFTQTTRLLDARRKVNPLMIQALLELLHNILKQTSVVVRAALQSQRLSCPAAKTEAAEKLLAANRPLSQLSIYLIQMLSTENQEMWEESIQCLSLLVQLYGGEGHDCLSPSCLQSFSHILQAYMHAEMPQVQRTTLRIIKRLIHTTERSDWVKCHEGEELMSILQDMTSSGRCHADMNLLAAELIQEIFRF